MNRANQQVLNQVANQEVILIRQTEIEYYINLFTVFGTNAALYGGFTYGILTQNIFAQSSKDFQLYKFVYYVFAATTIASSVHIIVTTMLLQVYGPGLAYFGPLGSMALAAEGMREEQKQVISATMLMVSSFVCGTVWLYFCVMTFYGAVISTVGTLVAIRYWYYFCERIYLRFYWKVQEGAWNEAPRDSRFHSEDENPANRLNIQKVAAQTNKAIPPPHYSKKKLKFPFGFSFGGQASNTADNEDAGVELDNTGYADGVFSYIFRNPATIPEAERASLSSSSAPPSATTAARDAYQSGSGMGVANSPLHMEGYFTTRGRNEQMKLLEARRWERKYFILYRTGDCYIYDSRNDYRTQPTKPIFTRPLRLIDFFVKVDNTDEETRSELEGDGQTVVSAATTVRTAAKDANKPLPFRFQITLVPRENEADDVHAQFRNHWLLRCDTEEELEIWLSAIRDVCPSCFRGA